MLVTSQPSGARVMINGHPAGLTPTGPIRFDHYGVYEIFLEREGYLPHVARVELKPRWHGRFPLDFFAENLWPGRIVDRRELAFTLRPRPRVDRRALLERALKFRKRHRP